MIPENEMGVIVVFAEQAAAAGWRVLQIGADFPDAVVEKDGQAYRAEFEFKAHHFIRHGHDPRACDMIICWSRGSYRGSLPVLELNDPNWHDYVPVLPSEGERELEYWRIQAFYLRRQLTLAQNALSGRNEAIKPYRQPVARAAIMRYIKEHEDAVTAADIAAHFNVTDRSGRRYLAAYRSNGHGQKEPTA